MVRSRVYAVNIEGARAKMNRDSTRLFTHEALYGASPAQAVGRFFVKYFNFRGRASMSEFWWVFGFLVLISVAIGIIDRHFGVDIETIAEAVLVIPVVSLMCRRLHDSGRTGLLCLIGFIPVLGGIALLFMMALPTRDNPEL